MLRHSPHLHPSRVQQLEQLGLVVPDRRHHERRDLAAAAHRRPRAQQLPHRVEVTHHRRLGERALARVVRRVDVGAVRDEPADQLELARPRRLVQRRVAIPVPRPQVGAARGQLLESTHAAVAHGGEEQAAVAGGRRARDVGAEVGEPPRHVEVAHARRLVDRGVAPFVRRIGRRASRDEPLHHAELAGARGLEDGRVAVPVLLVDEAVAVLPHQLLQAAEVALVHRLAELAARLILVLVGREGRDGGRGLG
mmetsp:Transcript_2151/g.3781  ORF Transcript_2151/g.3781 Transcript_2151/m.3781 type:complete len:252 (+) Transcript_2151:294-1049(+)